MVWCVLPPHSPSIPLSVSPQLDSSASSSSDQLLTFSFCPGCNSIPSVTAAPLVTHLDELSDELHGMIQDTQLATRETQREPLEPKATPASLLAAL